MFCKLYPSVTSTGCRLVPRRRLLCLHGLMGSGQNWTTVASQLAGKAPNGSPKAPNEGGGCRIVGTSCDPSTNESALPCDVLTLDWPNHGRSDHTDAPHSLETMAAALDVLLQPAQALQGLHSHLSDTAFEGGGVGRLEGGICADLAPWTRAVGGAPAGDPNRCTAAPPSTWFVPTTSAATHAQWTKDEPISRTSATSDVPAMPSSPSQVDIKDVYEDAPTSPSASAYPQAVPSLLYPVGIQEPPKDPPRTVLMAHSMGGAAVMHFLLTRYAPGTRHIPLEKVIIVDIAPCQRPAYTQQLVDAVLALEALRIPTRTGGAGGGASRAANQQRLETTLHEDGGSLLRPAEPINDTEKRAAAATDTRCVTTRAQAQETLLANARGTGLRAFSGNAGLWLARYLLSNLQDGDGGQTQSRLCNEEDDKKEKEKAMETGGDGGTTRSSRRDGGVGTDVPAIHNSRLEWTSNTPAIIAGLAQGALQWPTRFEYGEESPQPSSILAANTTPTTSSLSCTQRPPPGSGPGPAGDPSHPLPPPHALPHLPPSPLQPYRHGRTTPVHFIFGGASPYWTDVPAATAIQYYFGGGVDSATADGIEHTCEHPNDLHIHQLHQAGHFLFIEKPREFVALVRTILADTT